VSPFFASYHYHPRTGIEPPGDLKSLGPKRFDQLAADEVVSRKERLWQHLKDEIQWASEQYAIQANKHRQPAPDYKVGDMVMLKTKNIKTERPCAKLDNTSMGPFPITRVAYEGSAYELQLSPALKFIHPVFHPSLLIPIPGKPPYPGQHLEPPPPTVVIREGIKQKE
jgi:hypothetical protein